MFKILLTIIIFKCYNDITYIEDSDNMKIIKYEKKGNNTYKIYLENNQSINVYEDVILKNNLLYKKEIDRSLLEKINIDNDKEDI